MSEAIGVEETRRQLVEAIDWIDAERKRLARHCFAETRKKWHGEHDRGRAITLMKKESEWLYRQRCRLREQLGEVNTAIKDSRRARNGTVSATFGSTFVEVAREKLPPELFDSLVSETTARFGRDAHPRLANASGETPARTPLEELHAALLAFRQSNERPPLRGFQPPRQERRHDWAPTARDDRAGDAPPERDSQADFNLEDAAYRNRVWPACGR